jgi:two-component system response regulator YesN
LIADDEHLARLVLTSLLEEIDPSFSIVEAVNGKDLHEKAISFLPHIAIVDIQMPLLTGLDAIKRLKETLPMTQWLILTGFAKFDYAKEAIALQVADYMVKPIRKNQLEQFLNQAYSKVNHLIEADNATFEQQLRISMKQNQIKKDTSLYQVAILAFDNKNPENQAITISHLLKTAKDWMHETFEIVARGTIFQLDDTSLAIVGSALKKETLEQLFIPCVEKILTCSPSPLWAFSSAIFCNMMQVPQTIEILQKRIRIRLVVKPFVVHPTNCVPSNQKTEVLEGISQTMLEAIQLKNSGKTIVAKQKKEEAVERALLLDIKDKRELACFLSYLYSFYEQQIPHDFSNLTFAALQALLEDTFHKRSDGNSFQIEKVLNYLQDHYAEDIGVKDIASLIEISPNYLSAKFKQETGKRFLEYLTELRVNRSKLLLKNTTFYIHMIAKEVGFNDVKYFSHVFEQIVGCSPSKFRETEEV